VAEARASLLGWPTTKEEPLTWHRAAAHVAADQATRTTQADQVAEARASLLGWPTTRRQMMMMLDQICFLLNSTYTQADMSTGSPSSSGGCGCSEMLVGLVGQGGLVGHGGPMCAHVVLRCACLSRCTFARLHAL
jgi:hypothetical protein